MQALFPAIKPYHKQLLDVGQGYRIYVEECGKPQGIPVLFVHGGPGGGCTEDHRRYFDPNLYRIILFDQRGCGRSLPHAGLQHNTTQDLLADMEKIREALAIDAWILFGGSWGTTLSLIYAETYPDRVSYLILRGIYLNRKQDIDWLYRYGANKIFPDYWQAFIDFIPSAERDDIIKAYHKRLNGADEIQRMNAAKHWALWEGRCASLAPNQHIIDAFSDPSLAMSFAKVSTHYFMHNCFLDENQILDNIDNIKSIPGVIIHGRYDLICALEGAWTLSRHWPAGQLRIVRAAGHAASEPGIIDALVRATKEAADFFAA